MAEVITEEIQQEEIQTISLEEFEAVKKELETLKADINQIKAENEVNNETIDKLENFAVQCDLDIWKAQLKKN